MPIATKFLIIIGQYLIVITPHTYARGKIMGLSEREREGDGERARVLPVDESVCVLYMYVYQATKLATGRRWVIIPMKRGVNYQQDNYLTVIVCMCMCVCV